MEFIHNGIHQQYIVYIPSQYVRD